MERGKIDRQTGENSSEEVMCSESRRSSSITRPFSTADRVWRFWQFGTLVLRSGLPVGVELAMVVGEE